MRAVLLSLLLAALLLVGCMMIEPDVKNADAVATYNNQMFQLMTQIVTGVMTLLGIIWLYVRQRLDKKELMEKTEQAAKLLALETKQSVTNVIHEVHKGNVLNEAAIAAANNHNEKILDLQKHVVQVVEQGKRAPSRSTDKETVQKVEITAGPGIDAPLKVHETK